MYIYICLNQQQLNTKEFQSIFFSFNLFITPRNSPLLLELIINNKHFSFHSEENAKLKLIPLIKQNFLLNAFIIIIITFKKKFQKMFYFLNSVF